MITKEKKYFQTIHHQEKRKISIEAQSLLYNITWNKKKSYSKFHEKQIYTAFNNILSFKNIFDKFFTLLLFISIFSWLWPLIIIAIKINSKGAVFYKQKREGKNGKMFICYKFRTMKSNPIKEDETFRQAQKNDTRITLTGRILRHYSLDELPQFYNVLKGDMSVVGPRPHPLPLNKIYRTQIPYYDLRHKIKPGISGLAQIKGLRGPTNLHTMEERVKYDIYYQNNWSLLLDLKIIFISLWKVLKGDVNAF